MALWSAPDAAEQCLDEAHGLLTVISHAFAMTEDMDQLRGQIFARALEGVARLVAMGQQLHMGSSLLVTEK